MTVVLILLSATGVVL